MRKFGVTEQDTAGPPLSGDHSVVVRLHNYVGDQFANLWTRWLSSQLSQVRYLDWASATHLDFVDFLLPASQLVGVG